MPWCSCWATAVSPIDYGAVSYSTEFNRSEFGRDFYVDGLVARKPVPDFAIVNDDIYEGSERFNMIIQQADGLRDGLVQFADPDGATCVQGDCTPHTAYRVTITDEEDLLSEGRVCLGAWARGRSIR